MGFFDAFKKKKEPAPAPVENKMNSIFTLKFAVPFFQVFDRTNPKMANFPIKLSTAGSVQYRIADPDLCFDNVSLRQMTPDQVKEHVLDGLTAVIKAFMNQISHSLPVLQFEAAIMKINEKAKEYIIPTFQEEYGINLRTFNLSRITYDVEDPNYLQLQRLSREAVNQMSEKQASEHELEMERSKMIIDRERKQLEVEMKGMDLDLKARDLHLAEDIHTRRMATDEAAKSGALNMGGKSLSFDDDEFKIDGL